MRNAGELQLSYAARPRRYVLLDTSVETISGMQGGRYQTVALAGVVYSVKPGIDIDVGYRQGLTVAARTRQLRSGFTCRGAL